MELKDYTIEELRAELKRRNELIKAQKNEEMKNALRCRNCKHCVHSSISWINAYLCNARTWGKAIKRNYVVKLYQKACDKFERKIEE